MTYRLRRWARLLTLRSTAQDLWALDKRDLTLGLASTWLVGMGRHWDDPGAKFLQQSGLGSVIYVFVLSLLLWLVIWPLRPAKWSYPAVLTFVALVSPPAALYAFPIERFASLETARTVNAWFLATVATWRVALLVYFLRVSARLGYPRVVVGSLVPLTMVVTALTMLNLDRAVFDIMGGRRGPGTPHDSAYALLFVVTYFSMLAFVPLLLAYAVLVIRTDRAVATGSSASPTEVRR
jgi:uncharacterized protein (DUF486 family)